MSKSIARHCPHCKKYQSIAYINQKEFNCPQCKEKWGMVKSMDDIFDYCPICDCRQFYLSKDFNQFVGCLIMVVGIVLVPMTYGISLPVFALIDWLLHRKVGYITNCYKCGCEFRGFDTQKRFKPFLHHIGLKYDKFR